MNKTKIVATIGPKKSSNRETLISMIEAGMNIARINFSHGDHEKHAAAIKLIRELNEELGSHVGILGDLQGPKIRLGEVAVGAVLLEGELTLTTETCDGDANVCISHTLHFLPMLLQEIRF